MNLFLGLKSLMGLTLYDLYCRFSLLLLLLSSSAVDGHSTGVSAISSAIINTYLSYRFGAKIQKLFYLCPNSEENFLKRTHFEVLMPHQSVILPPIYTFMKVLAVQAT